MYIIRTEAFKNGQIGYEVINSKTLKRFCVTPNQMIAQGICETLNARDWETDCRVMLIMIQEWANSAHRVDLKEAVDFLVSKVEN